MKKITGFSQKFHPYQILSYVIFFCDLSSYVIFVTSLSDNISKIVGTIIIIITSIMIIYFGYQTTAIDSTDDYVIQTLILRASGKFFDAPRKEFYCSTCYAFVQERSKHCKRCNRCVQNFDHHCKWVNNCIGSKNYKVFIYLINSVLIFSITYIIFTIILTIQYINQMTLNDNNIYMLNNNQVLIGMIIIWIFCIINIILFIMDLHLVLMHYWLIKNKLTTYEYIVSKELLKEASDDKSNNDEKVNKINNDNNDVNNIKNETKKTCLDFILCLGIKKKNILPNNDNKKDLNDDKINDDNKDIDMINYKNIKVTPDNLDNSADNFNNRSDKINSNNNNNNHNNDNDNSQNSQNSHKLLLFTSKTKHNSICLCLDYENNYNNNSFDHKHDKQCEYNHKNEFGCRCGKKNNNKVNDKLNTHTDNDFENYGDENIIDKNNYDDNDRTIKNNNNKNCNKDKRDDINDNDYKYNYKIVTDSEITINNKIKLSPIKIEKKIINTIETNKQYIDDVILALPSSNIDIENNRTDYNNNIPLSNHDDKQKIDHKHQFVDKHQNEDKLNGISTSLKMHHLSESYNYSSNSIKEDNNKANNKNKIEDSYTPNIKKVQKGNNIKLKSESESENIFENKDELKFNHHKSKPHSVSLSTAGDEIQSILAINKTNQTNEKKLKQNFVIDINRQCREKSIPITDVITSAIQHQTRYNL